MSIIQIKGKAKSTVDCVILIKKHIKKAKWKRISKRKFEDHEVRIFKNELNEFCTIIVEITNRLISDLRIMENFDLSIHYPLIDEILRVAKNYYTYDYGTISFNMIDTSLSMSGGDGGYFYSVLKTKKQIEKIFEDGFCTEDINDFDKEWVEVNKHPTLTSIPKVDWEAEWSPDEGEEWLDIGSITLLD